MLFSKSHGNKIKMLATISEDDMVADVVVDGDRKRMREDGHSLGVSNDDARACNEIGGSNSGTVSVNNNIVIP